jgi:hypothetical protein
VPPPADDLESALLSLGGGRLAGRGHGALDMMTAEMAGYLDTLAGGHPANGVVADPLADVLDRLARRLRNPDVRPCTSRSMPRSSPGSWPSPASVTTIPPSASSPGKRSRPCWPRPAPRPGPAAVITCC